MELALLVYGVSLLHNISVLAWLITCMGGTGWAAWKINSVIDGRKGPPWYTTLIIVLSISILILLPSEKTAYTMIGAYAVQKAVETPEVKELSADVYKIISEKVKEYAEEAEVPKGKK